MGWFLPKEKILCFSLIISCYLVGGSVIFLSRPDKPKIIPDTGKTWFDKDKPAFNFDGPAVGRPFLPDQESPYKIFDTVAELSPFNAFSHHPPENGASSSSKNDAPKSGQDSRLAQTLDGDTYYGIRAHDLIESPEKISDQIEDLENKGALVPPGEANNSIPRKEDDIHNLDSPFPSGDAPIHHEISPEKDGEGQADGASNIETTLKGDKIDVSEHEDVEKSKSDTVSVHGNQSPRIVNHKPPPIHVTESTATDIDKEAEKPTSAMVQNESPTFSVNDVINSEKAAMNFAKQFGDVFPDDKGDDAVANLVGNENDKQKAAPHLVEEIHNTLPKSVPPTTAHEIQPPVETHPDVITNTAKQTNIKHSTSPVAPKENKKHHHVTIDTDTGEIINEAVVTIPDKMHKQVKNDIEKLESDKPFVKHDSSRFTDDNSPDGELQAASFLGSQMNKVHDFHKSFNGNLVMHEMRDKNDHLSNHQSRDYHETRDISHQEAIYSQDGNKGIHNFHSPLDERAIANNRIYKSVHTEMGNRNHHSRMLSDEMMHEGDSHKSDDHDDDNNHDNDDHNAEESDSHSPSHERENSSAEGSHLVSHYDYHDMHGASNEHRDEHIDPETSFDHHNHDRQQETNHESSYEHESPHSSRDDYHEPHDSHDEDTHDDSDDSHESNDTNDDEAEGNPRQSLHSHDKMKEVTSYYQDQPHKDAIRFSHKNPDSEDIPEMTRGKANERKKPDFGDFDKEFPPPKSGLRNKHRKPEEDHHDDLLLHHESASNLHLDKEREKDMHHDDIDDDEHDADADHDDDDDEHEYTKEDPEEHEEDVHMSRVAGGQQTHYHKHIHHHNHIHIHSPTDQRVIRNGFRHLKLHDMDAVANAMGNAVHGDHGRNVPPKMRPDMHPPFNARSDEFQPEDDVQKLATSQQNLLDPLRQFPPTKPVVSSQLLGKYSPSPVPPDESAPLRAEPLQPIPNARSVDNERTDDDAGDAMIKPESDLKPGEEPLHPNERLGEPSNKSAMKDDDEAQYGSEYYHMVEGVKKMKKVGRFLPSSDTTSDHMHENEVFDNNNLTNDIDVSKEGSNKRHTKRIKKPSFAMEPKIESQHEVVEPGYMVHEDPRGDGLGAGVIDGPEIGNPVSSPPDTGSSSKREQLNVTADIPKKEEKKENKNNMESKHEFDNNKMNDDHESDESSHHSRSQHVLMFPPGETFKVEDESKNKESSERDPEDNHGRTDNTQKEMSSLLHSNVLQKFASHIIRNQSFDDHGETKNYDNHHRKISDEDRHRDGFSKLDEMHLNGFRNLDEDHQKSRVKQRNGGERNEAYNREPHSSDEEHGNKFHHSDGEHEKQFHPSDGEHEKELQSSGGEHEKEGSVRDDRRLSEDNHSPDQHEASSDIQDNHHFYPRERGLSYGTPQKSRLFSSIQEHLENIEVDDLNKLQEEIKAIKSKKMYKAKTVSPVSRSPQKVHLNLDVHSSKYKIPERQLTLPLQNPGHPDDMNGVIDTSAIKPAKKMPLLNPSPVADLEEDAASKKHTLTPKHAQVQKGSPKNIIAHENSVDGHDNYGMVTLHGSETDYDLQPFVIASKYKGPTRKKLKAKSKKIVNMKGEIRSLVRKLDENRKSLDNRITKLIDKKGLSHFEESPLVIGEYKESSPPNVENPSEHTAIISKKSFFEKRPYKKRLKKPVELVKANNFIKQESTNYLTNSTIIDKADIPKVRKRVLSFKRSAEKLDGV